MTTFVVMGMKLQFDSRSLPRITMILQAFLNDPSRSRRLGSYGPQKTVSFGYRLWELSVRAPSGKAVVPTANMT